MLLAFVLNGACAFGLRILKADGYAGTLTSNYLFFWYLGGAVALGLLALAKRGAIGRNDLAVGAGLGLCSFCGQTCISRTLEAGVSGSVAYPVVLGGGLFIVVLTGVTVFRERVGPVGWVGIGLGLTAVALLAM